MLQKDHHSRTSMQAVCVTRMKTVRTVLTLNSFHLCFRNFCLQPGHFAEYTVVTNYIFLMVTNQLLLSCRIFPQSVTVIQLVEQFPALMGGARIAWLV